MNKYYQDYEQGVNTYTDKYNIKLPSEGLKETLTQKPKLASHVVDLSKDIRSSKYLYSEEPKHSHKYKINKFHRFKGKDVDYQIAENDKGNYYFYKIVEPNLTGPKPEGRVLQGLDNSKHMNIVTHDNANFNPTEENSLTPKLNSFKEWLEELKRKRRRF